MDIMPNYTEYDKAIRKLRPFSKKLEDLHDSVELLTPEEVKTRLGNLNQWLENHLEYTEKRSDNLGDGLNSWAFG